MVGTHTTTHLVFVIIGRWESVASTQGHVLGSLLFFISSTLIDTDVQASVGFAFLDLGR